MAWTLKANGTQTSTVTTEHTLSTITDNGTYVFVVDIAPLAAGDTLELRAYYKCLTGGTERLMWVATYQNAQTEAMVMAAPIPSDISVKFTLKQTAGSTRDFPWKVLSQ